MYTRLPFLVLITCVLAAAAVPNQYIVEMEGDPVATHVARHAPRAGVHGQVAGARRAQIQEQHRVVRAQVEASEAQVVGTLDTVANAFIVNIADEKAATLASIPGVLRVHPVRKFKLVLDHALPLHHVPEAWQQVGLGNAGAGMKIAMIDTGIDVQHAGFQDPSLTIPAGFPRMNASSDLAYTNNKVIVARSYSNLFDSPDPDPSARDHVGHGTATAMAAAGVANTGPLAAISGVAPKAWLGSYKVFGSPGVNDGASESAILTAIEDAVNDGMDVISLSLGSLEASRIQDDIEVQALERAAGLGLIVVVAAGNDGPAPNTISSPGTAPSAITVGAAKNDRVFAGSATIAGGAPVVALPGSGANSPTPITAPLASVVALDQNGLACLPLPNGSLQGRIALILRGTCTFTVKLTNAQSAGAVAALVVVDAQEQDPFTMGVGTASLPASMVGNADGAVIEQQLAQNPSLSATLTFTLGPLSASTDGLVTFSSQGPSVDLSVKPDLIAVGVNFYTATQTFDKKGEMYDPTGYTITQGTSFATPLVAGAAALLKAARPGLTNAQYRSLLIDSAGVAPSGTVLQTGTGILNMAAALNATAAATPAEVSFQVGDGNPNLSRSLTISNLGSSSTVFQLTAMPRSGAPAPALSASAISLDAGASAQIAVNFSASALGPGQYEGYIRVADTSTGLEAHVPYWYAVPSNTPAFITVLNASQGVVQTQSGQDSVLFRVTDASGIALTNIQPVVTVISGTGVLSSVNSRNSLIPGAFGINLRLGAKKTTTVVRIQAGDITQDVPVSN
jgi:minor extracellular serine protease Vpr